MNSLEVNLGVRREKAVYRTVNCPRMHYRTWSNQICNTRAIIVMLIISLNSSLWRRKEVFKVRHKLEFSFVDVDPHYVMAHVNFISYIYII